jgi:hypothetical protein
MSGHPLSGQSTEDEVLVKVLGALMDFLFVVFALGVPLVDGLGPALTVGCSDGVLV